MPVEASVAAIFEPIWPLLPTPVTITRPSIRDTMSTARAKGSASPFSSAGGKCGDAGLLGRDRAQRRRDRSLPVQLLLFQPRMHG